MKIILSPAKKMNINDDMGVGAVTSPRFLEQTEEILAWMQEQPHEDLQKLWACNDKIADACKT